MDTILIGLGANLKSKNGASPIQNLQHAVGQLQVNGVTPVSGSSIWKSAPVPLSDQPWYHNAVCQVKTELSPKELLHVVARIEEAAGRKRFERNEPRIMDLDILAYNDKIIKTAQLQIPHPHMHERAFVLLPLQEIVSHWAHPVSGKTLKEMIAALDPAQKIEQTKEKLF